MVDMEIMPMVEVVKLTILVVSFCVLRLVMDHMDLVVQDSGVVLQTLVAAVAAVRH
jgi:hypothetical protein